PCRIIPQEYANIDCSSIDVVLPPENGTQEECLVQALLEEVTIEKAEAIVAYRGEYRWVQTFEPIALENVVTRPAVLKGKGVYLITGGLGGIGLVFAEYLAKKVKAKLVLVGRTGLPERSEWKTWLDRHD